MNYLISDYSFHQSPVLQENKNTRKYDKPLKQYKYNDYNLA